MVDDVGTTPKEIPVLLPLPLPNSADYQEPANGGIALNPTFMIRYPVRVDLRGMILNKTMIPPSGVSDHALPRGIASKIAYRAVGPTAKGQRSVTDD